MWVSGCGLLPSAFITQIWLRGRQQLVPNKIRVPSGDQSGLPASRLGSVSRLTPPPLAFITQTALMYPPRLLSKAIWCPLGEYSGIWLIQFPPRSFLIPDPSAFITSRSQNSVKPNGTAQWENTILRPSGDQDGCWFWNPAWLVSWCWALPSAFITQIWPSIVNTTRVPSGENSGEPAAWPFGTCVSCRRPVPSGLMVKICGRWLKAVSNTILPFMPGNAARAGPPTPTSPTTARPATATANVRRMATPPCASGSPAFSSPSLGRPYGSQTSGSIPQTMALPAVTRRTNRATRPRVRLIVCRSGRCGRWASAVRAAWISSVGTEGDREPNRSPDASTPDCQAGWRGGGYGRG